MARPKKDHVEDMERAQKQAAQSELRLSGLNQRFAITNWGGHGTTGKQTTIVFERDSVGRILHMRGIEDFPKHPEVLGKTITIGDVAYPLAPFWLEWSGATKFNRIVFAPEGSKEQVGITDYQTWHGFAVDAAPGKWDTTRAFIRDVICSGNESHERWLHNWLAALFQEPGQHGHVAVTLLGGQGIGKSVFCENVIGDVLPKEHFLALNDSKRLTSDFNAHLSERVVVFCDEAFFAGKKEADKVKTLITQGQVTINPKHLPVEVQQSCMHILISSNSLDPIHMDADDRRYFVLRVSEAHKNDTKYFNRLLRALKHEHPAMLHYFQSIAVDRDALRLPPLTSEKARIKISSLDAEAEWWQSRLDRTDDEWVSVIPSAELNRHYTDWIDQYRRNARKRTPKALGLWLGNHFKAGGMADWPKRYKVGPRDAQSWVYEFPDLGTCLAAFETATGTKVA